MAEEFQAGVCGGNWWNSSKAVFGSSPCSSVINDIGSYGWPAGHDLVTMKAKSSDESSDGSMVFQDIEKPSGGAATMSSDSTFQIMGIGLSSSTSTTDWYQSLFEDSSINTIKGANQGFLIDQQPLNSITSSGDCTATCQGLATSFPISSTSYAYPSTLLQTLFENNSPPQQSLFDNGSINYPSTKNKYHANFSEFSGSLPFWKASSSALNDLRANDIMANYFSSAQPQYLSSTYEEKPNCPNLTAKSNNEEIRDSGSVVKKTCSEPAFKRQRLEMPSPLPTFKVRKEKLGDRITALQQLVSPFGKTDTASVLHEAIEYIKLLHDQVNVLSTPYMKNGAGIQRQQIPDKVKDKEGAKQDLKSRGLCLVPVSSTFPVAAETTPDFWTPTFGGTFR